MTEIVLNESGIRAFFERPDGPTGRYLAGRAVGVTRRALHNASGRPGPNIRSGDLLRGTRFKGIVPDGRGIAAVVVSEATHDGFNYPIAQELGGVTPTGGYYRYPFLEPALAEEFGLPYQGGGR